MKADSVVLLDAVQVHEQLTITVRPRRVGEARARYWLAVRLIRLACWIANFTWGGTDRGVA